MTPDEVVSPPQDLAKSLCQTRPEFDALCRYIDDSMLECGALAGVTVFHAWRQTDTMWEFSPHFHILCYGRINTKRFQKENPGWIIKKVHPSEKIRSIRHTASYLYTHMALGLSEKDADDVDWDLRFLDYMVPGILSPGAHYTDKDYDLKGEGKGRMVGDTSYIDWFDWTTSRLTGEFKLRYFGGVSKGNIRSIYILRQYKIRVCKECGTPLRTYDGFSDDTGSPVMYIQDNPVVVFRRNFDRAKQVLKEFLPRFEQAGLTLLDFAKQSNFAVCTLELPTPPNDDLMMNGPFEEPDSYYLRRQNAAYNPMIGVEA